MLGMGLWSKVKTAKKAMRQESLCPDAYWENNPLYAKKTDEWKQKEMNGALWGNLYHTTKRMIQNKKLPLIDDELQRILPVQFVCAAQTDAAGHELLNGIEYQEEYFQMANLWYTTFEMLLSTPTEWIISFPWKPIFANDSNLMFDLWNALTFEDILKIIQDQDQVRVLVEGSPSVEQLADGINYPIANTLFVKTETAMSLKWQKDIVINHLVALRYPENRIQSQSMNKILRGESYTFFN